MKKSKLVQKTITKLAEVSFKDGKMVENQVIKAIKVLKSLPKYEAIQALSEYLKSIKRMMRQYTMYIETVIPLSYAQIIKAKKIVEKKHLTAGRKVIITKVVTAVNPQILGGFKLRVGDEIYDESILGKINQVKEVIAGGRSNSTN